MAVTEAAGEHLGAVEEEQGELKDKKIFNFVPKYPEFNHFYVEN